MRLHRLAVFVFFITCTAFTFAQDDGGGSNLDFGLGLAIGAQSFPNPDYTGTGTEPAVLTYQSLTMTPDLALGKFGIGLDVTLNYTFTGGDGTQFEVRREDWVPDENTNFLELYLPKFRYVRWAMKGDPLYVLLGQIDYGVLGNGFIVGGYTNTQYAPDRKLFGLSLDVDGQLFNFPYVGIETFASNLAAFDLMGGRLFVRPLIGTSIPIVKNLQVGTTYAIDRDPFYFASKDMDPAFLARYLPDGASAADASVSIWGADVQLPILTNPAVSLAAFGDYVMQGDSRGGMIGFGGRLISIIPYRAELRFLGDNFVPNYFDLTYDLFRPERYATYAGVDSTGYVGDVNGDGVPDGNNFATDSSLGWFAQTGFALLEDQILFSAQIDGPFVPSGSAGSFPNPHLLATLSVAEGLLGGFSLSALYDKQDIDGWANLISPEDAVIGARLNYKIENAVISLVYDLQYDPNPEPGDDPWIITSGIESAISLF